MKFLNKLKAFTLAEVIITLVVIGIIAAVVIPVAIQSKPDENIMKFKKAHNTLYQVVKTLINSDKFYKDGDLGVKPNGDLIDGTHSGDKKYFCNSMADLLSTKTVNCTEESTENTEPSGFVQNVFVGPSGDGINDCANSTEVKNYMNNIKTDIDSRCKRLAAKTNQRIITTDKVTYYEGNPKYTYGLLWKDTDSPQLAGGNCYDTHSVSTCETRLFGGVHLGCDGFNRIYKLFCIDIDGIPADGSENCDDEKDICPFGYGIRADGHIMTGARADEWLKKDFHGEE